MVSWMFYLIRTRMNVAEHFHVSAFVITKNQVTHDKTTSRQVASLEEQFSEAREAVQRAHEERDNEKKARVGFEMRLVEFEDYRKHAESDIVSNTRHITH